VLLKSPVKRLARRMADDKKGATAVEFALVALPFVVLLGAILETALVFFAGIMMEHGLSQSAREIRTGQLQLAGGSSEAFRDSVCSRSAGLLRCERLRIDVRTLESFGGATSLPVDENGMVDAGAISFLPGDPGEIVLVRAYYDWPLIMPNLGLGLANMAGNRRLLTATAAFRNEPFQEALQ
jgi:Flp pilus assembly protein TadG